MTSKLTSQRRRRTPAHRARLGTCRPRLEQLEDRNLLDGNPIVTENQQTGTPDNIWGVGSGDTSIQGFATDMSVNHGQTISFKVKTANQAPYRIDIYRMGYYQDNGARFVATIPSLLGQDQPVPLPDPETGLVDAGSWNVSASWAVPATAVSGLYFARLTREDTGKASAAYFVVRDDERHSDLLFQTSDSTWQAYNNWGGKSLYDDSSDGGRAYKVSYNRPLTVDAQGNGGLGNWNSPMHAEYPMIRWLEANGYDTSYSTDVDSDRNGSLILNHKTFLSVGHDEYWSAGQRTKVEAARNAGVNLAFFSGNECYWKTRWEPDGSDTPYRTLVCYKESKANAEIDDDPAWTGTWRDWRFNPADANKPENALTGTIYMNDRTSDNTGVLGIPLNVTAADGRLRFWRNTDVAGLEDGQTATLGQYIVGYETDEDLDNGWRPAGLIDMSTTSFTTETQHVTASWGTIVGPGSSTHSITLYRAPGGARFSGVLPSAAPPSAGGALVFGAGTVQWSWGLDAHHNNDPTTPNLAMRQATVNLFADMGVQPGSLQLDTGVRAASASTDVNPPWSQINYPGTDANLDFGNPITIIGSAGDLGGGVVGGVEVSVDGGLTWHPAVGKSAWTYTWTPSAEGNIVVKSRAADDSCNVETPGSGVTVHVAPQKSWTLWPATAKPAVAADSTDPSAKEVGVKFTSDVDGRITGLRFYKGPGNNGLHVGHLWTDGGGLLYSANFTAETASGWQQVDFPDPVEIQAGVPYRASYFAPNGQQPYDSAYFAKNDVNSGVLHAEQVNNGVFHPDSSDFPTQVFHFTNYWVDVVFSTSAAPVFVTRTPPPDTTGVDVNTNVTITFDRAMNADTITGSTFHLRETGSLNDVLATVSYDSATRTATLDPTLALLTDKTYQVTVSGTVAAVNNATLGPPDVTWSFTTKPYLIITDTIAADFSAGQTDAGTAVAQTANGEVILKPAAGCEFFGTALPADWTSSTWGGGGSAIVSGGLLSVNGAAAGTTAYYSAGQSLEFVATFNGDAWQHVGFGIDYNDNHPWAIFSTFTGGPLYARTNNGSDSMNTLIPGNWLGIPHRFRIDWNASSAVYFIDGNQMASHGITIPGTLRPLASDANVGGGSVTVDWLRMTPYAALGTFKSRLLDAGAAAHWIDATWSAMVPSGTHIAISVRLGNTTNPDDVTWTQFTPLESSPAPINQSGYRYLQYRAVLDTTDVNVTPALRDITFKYSTSLLQLDGAEVAPAADVQSLTQEALAPIVSEAAALWVAAGADGAALSSVQVRIADLAGTILGAETPGVIWIDVNAAGHGWFIDPTAADPVTPGRLDLLTVVAHEMGHALGLAHSQEGVMQENLQPGVRHMAGCGCSACLAAAAAAAAPTAQTTQAPTAPNLLSAASLADPPAVTDTVPASPPHAGADNQTLLALWGIAFPANGGGTGTLPSSDGQLGGGHRLISAAELRDSRPGGDTWSIASDEGTGRPFVDPPAESAIVDQLFAALGGATDGLGVGLGMRPSLS